MPRYIGDDGKIMWWGKNTKNKGDYDCDIYKEYGLYEFTDIGMELVEKLFYGWYRNDVDQDVYEAEWYGLDCYFETDWIDEYSKLEGIPPYKYYQWKEKREEWEIENLDNDSNFKLSVNEKYWEAESDDNDIKKLVNAYINDERDVLTRNSEEW